VHPPGVDPYYVANNLSLAPSSAHAQVADESAFSSANASIHKFRWVHVAGLAHQGGTPAFGTYTYVVTPRYFSTAGALEALDASTSVSVNVQVEPFVKGALTVSFTRGYVQSQAFVRHFGPTARIRPDGDDLEYDTSATVDTNATGNSFTYAEEYEWLGFTARQRVFDILSEVQGDPSLKLDVFAYDLNEPDVVALLFKLGSTGQVRIILDNAARRTSSQLCWKPWEPPSTRSEVASPWSASPWQPPRPGPATLKPASAPSRCLPRQSCRPSRKTR